MTTKQIQEIIGKHLGNLKDCPPQVEAMGHRIMADILDASLLAVEADKEEVSKSQKLDPKKCPANMLYFQCKRCGIEKYVSGGYWMAVKNGLCTKHINVTCHLERRKEKNRSYMKEYNRNYKNAPEGYVPEKIILNPGDPFLSFECDRCGLKKNVPNRFYKAVTMRLCTPVINKKCYSERVVEYQKKKYQERKNKNKKIVSVEPSIIASIA